MATPTAKTLVDRLRGLLNEPATAFVDDDAEEALGWIADGLSEQHNAVLASLKELGRDKDVTHPYLSAFVATQTYNTVAGTRDYALPTDYDMPLWLSYGPKLRRGEIMSLDHMDLHEGGDLYSPSTTRIYWAPTGSNIRLMVVPGDEGVPAEVTPFELWYIRTPGVIADLATEVGVPRQFTQAPLFWACAMWTAKELKDNSAWIALFQASVTVIAKR